jgi:hypothetical protein
MDFYAAPKLSCGQATCVIVHRENGDIMIEQDEFPRYLSCVGA